MKAKRLEALRFLGENTPPKPQLTAGVLGWGEKQADTGPLSHGSPCCKPAFWVGSLLQPHRHQSMASLLCPAAPSMNLLKKAEIKRQRWSHKSECCSGSLSARQFLPNLGRYCACDARLLSPLGRSWIPFISSDGLQILSCAYYYLVLMDSEAVAEYC